MKEIVLQYGKMIIALIIFSVLITCFGGFSANGVGSTFYVYAKQAGKEQKEIPVCTQQFSDYNRRQGIYVSLKNGVEMIAGKSYLPEYFLHVVDYRGVEIPAQLEEITTPGGEILWERPAFEPEVAGRYMLKITARDGNFESCPAVICIPVQPEVPR